MIRKEDLLLQEKRLLLVRELSSRRNAQLMLKLRLKKKLRQLRKKRLRLKKSMR